MEARKVGCVDFVVGEGRWPVSVGPYFFFFFFIEDGPLGVIFIGVFLFIVCVCSLNNKMHLLQQSINFYFPPFMY
jgi:hypothetical protein